MKYDFETIIDRDPAIRGTGKYRIMKDSKGNKPPKGIVPLSVADMEFRTAPCVIDAIKAEADFGVLGYHRLTDSFRESCCQWMKIGTFSPTGSSPSSRWFPPSITPSGPLPSPATAS